jgi:hypothetical protein
MLEYFSSRGLALIVGSSHGWQPLGLVASGVLVEKFQSVGILSELLQYAWGSVFDRKHAVFANVVFVELR